MFALFSFKAQLNQALFSQYLRIESWRANLIRACFSQFSYLGFFILSLLIQTCIYKITSISMLLNHLMGPLDGTTLLFWSSDSRILSCSLWLLTSLIFTLLTRAQGWSVFIAMIMVPGHYMSDNVGLSLFVGEVLGLILGIVLRFRGLQSSVKKMLLILLVCYFPVGLFSWWLAGCFQFEIFWFKYAVFATPISLVLAIWGHFAAQKPIEDYQEVQALGSADLSKILAGLHRKQKNYLKLKVQNRIDSISGLYEEFQKVGWKQVPDFVKNTSEKELQVLIQTYEALPKV